MSELSDLEAKLGYRFSHTGLLEQALTHGSVRHEQQTGGDLLPAVEDNERLEFLGDAIVGLAVAELLYRRYPELQEGALTRLRAALVSRKHLGLVGTKLGLGGFLRLGKAEDRNGGRNKAVLLANCMEALIGALYLEGGKAVAAAFVEHTVTGPYVEELREELRENSAIGDYKTALQELLQARRVGQPEYLVEAESGPDHRKRFVVRVRFDDSPRQAQGGGSTKKKAEQEAARKLFEQLIAGWKNDEAFAAADLPAPFEEKHPTATVNGTRPLMRPALTGDRDPFAGVSAGPSRLSARDAARATRLAKAGTSTAPGPTSSTSGEKL